MKKIKKFLTSTDIHSSKKEIKERVYNDHQLKLYTEKYKDDIIESLWNIYKLREKENK